GDLRSRPLPLRSCASDRSSTRVRACEHLLSDRSRRLLGAAPDLGRELLADLEALPFDAVDDEPLRQPAESAGELDRLGEAEMVGRSAKELRRELLRGRL